MQSTSHPHSEGEFEPRPARAAETAPLARRDESGALPADGRSDFERRLHSFGLGARQRTLLGPTVFADDLEPETR
jgi:hypothetical protein